MNANRIEPRLRFPGQPAASTGMMHRQLIWSQRANGGIGRQEQIDGQWGDDADYRRYLAIFSFSKQTPTHLPILTHPSLLSTGVRRSLPNRRSVFSSSSLCSNRWMRNFFRRSLPERRSVGDRSTWFIFGLLWFADSVKGSMQMIAE